MFNSYVKLPEGNHQPDIRLLVDIANININRCRYYHIFHLLNIHHSTIILSYLLQITLIIHLSILPSMAGWSRKDQEDHVEVHPGLPAAGGWQHHRDQGRLGRRMSQLEVNDSEWLVLLVLRWYNRWVLFWLFGEKSPEHQLVSGFRAGRPLRTLSSSWCVASKWTASPATWERRSPSTGRKPRSMWLLSLLSPSVTWSIWARSTWRRSSCGISSASWPPTRPLTRCATSTSTMTRMRRSEGCEVITPPNRCATEREIALGYGCRGPWWVGITDKLVGFLWAFKTTALNSWFKNV